LNKKLRSIHLNGNYGGALGGSAFAKGLEGNKHLREVHLHGNAMGNEGARELMMGLMAHKGMFCWYVQADCRNIVLV
jgi:Ran GTPase-activating protein (RanGAP) involved in mRNA processing and transport